MRMRVLGEKLRVENENESSEGSFICFYRIFRIFEKLEDPSSNFPNFRKAVFQFRISLAALSKKNI